MLNEELLTVAGAAVVVTILTEVLKRAAAFTPEASDRWMPLIAVGLGILVAGGAALYQGADLFNGAVTGLLAGASAIGIYSGTKAGVAVARRTDADG